MMLMNQLHEKKICLTFCTSIRLLCKP